MKRSLMYTTDDEIKAENNRFRSLIRRLPSNLIGILAIAVIFGGVGAYLLTNSRAATPAASTEVESGTVSTAASKVTDTSASGGQAVKYAAPSSGGGVTFNTCTNPVHTLPTNPSNPQDGFTMSGYYITNDTWNYNKYPTATQTMYICDYNNWYVMINDNDNANNGEVKTYPNVHKDYNNVALSGINTLTSVYAHTMPNHGDWDAAYDVWFNGLNIELMIWTQSSGRQAHVPGIPQVGTVTLSGQTWNIHKTGGSYIAYDMPTAKTSGNINILEIIRDAQSRGYIPTTATLTQLDYGVEVCNTNSIDTRFEINNFSITSN